VFNNKIDNIQVKMIDFSNVALMTKKYTETFLPGSPPVEKKVARQSKLVCTLDYTPPKLLRQELDKECPYYELS
jgi:hypothetical protein